MRAMRINAKKNECVNASDRPFTMFSHCTYGYNIRNELVYSHRYEMHRRSSASEGRFGVAEPEGCASICEGTENQYDDIGNHSTNSSTPSLISMSYDALGRRASTTTLEGMTRHVYDDNWQVVADLDEDDNVVASYIWGEGIDNLLAIKVGGASYYPLTDIQGTIWGYVDSQNNVVARWRYDAWGNVLDEEVTVPALASIRYRFQCREWSAATGLVNFRMRWYDAEMGRWLSKDPIGLSGGLNLYAFCGNSPVVHVDPIGELWPAVGAAVGVAYIFYKIFRRAIETKKKIESADVNDLRDVMSKATDCCSDMMTDITPLFGPPLPDPLVPITDKISGEIVRPLWDDVFDKVRPIKPPE